MCDRESHGLLHHISSLGSFSVLVCGSFQAQLHQTQHPPPPPPWMGFGSVCDGHCNGLCPTAAPEMDGQLKTERRRSRSLWSARTPPNMQREFSVHLFAMSARERGENPLLLWALLISHSRTRKHAKRTRSLHSRLLQKQMLASKKYWFFMLLLLAENWAEVSTNDHLLCRDSYTKTTNMCCPPAPSPSPSPLEVRSHQPSKRNSHTCLILWFFFFFWSQMRKCFHVFWQISRAHEYPHNTYLGMKTTTSVSKCIYS